MLNRLKDTLADFIQQLVQKVIDLFISGAEYPWIQPGAKPHRVRLA